jgi:hypothetical protein
MKKQFVLYLLGLFFSSNVFAQSSGTFPAEPFNGMQANYSITGVTIAQFTDVPGYTWTRSLVISKIDSKGMLGISGTLSAGGLGCTVKVSVSAGGEFNSGTYEVKPGTPASFHQEVAIPANAKSANILIDMQGHYSMGGGSRGVVISGAYDSNFGNVTEAPEPDKYKPGTSPKEILNRMLDIYTKTIPKGIGTDGMTVNLSSWIDKETFDPYVCGGYQSKVLDFLERMRKTNQLEGYDYGPIQSWDGYHQAVVVYPKGTDWSKTGVVLDPWINQKPENFTIQDWVKINSVEVLPFVYVGIGIGPSAIYEGKYPITGGNGYINEINPEKLPTEVAKWYQKLPRDQYDALQILRKKDESAWANHLKNLFIQRNNDKKVIADCPLNLYVTDASGHITGINKGKFHKEIPDVSIMKFKLPDGTFWTELGYPNDKNYKVILESTGNGPAKVYTGFDMQDIKAKRSVYKYSFQVEKGQQYLLSQNDKNSPIQITDASKNKIGEINGIKITSTIDESETVVNTKNEIKIFDNGNIYGVTNGPTGYTQFKLLKSTFITRIENYHYFNNGKQPGIITLLNSEGKKVGSWQATGTAGQGGVQNAYWVAKPNITLQAGTYSVSDSDISTWSTNAQSSNKGFTTIWGSEFTPTSSEINSLNSDLSKLGNIWYVTECCGWVGTWTRRPNTNIYDAVWKNTNGATATDIIELQSWNRTTNQVKLYRQSINGTYTALYNENNGTLINGITTWYPSGQSWSAIIK